MEILLFENNEAIRKSFIENFVMSWDKFQVELKDSIDSMRKRNEVLDIDFYNKSYIWDKI